MRLDKQIHGPRHSAGTAREPGGLSAPSALARPAASSERAVRARRWSIGTANERWLDWLLILALVLLAVSPVKAAQAPFEVIAEATEKVVSLLREQGDQVTGDPDGLYGIVNDLILPNFDLAYMSSSVLGRYGRTIDDQQRQAFDLEWRTLLVRIFANALKENFDEKIEVLPVRDAAADDQVIVRSRVVRAEGPPVSIDYSLHIKDGEWKIYDVRVEKFTLVSNYRNSFSRELGRSGMSGLLSQLRQLNRMASN